MSKPQAKANLIRQQVLAALVAGKETTRNHKVLSDTPDIGEVITRKVPAGFALTYPLAANVSNDSVDRLARRWAK